MKAIRNPLHVTAMSNFKTLCAHYAIGHLYHSSIHFRFNSQKHFLLQVTCKVISVLLHFFYLSAIFWMLVEGLQIYSSIVKVFGGESKQRYFYFLGWGKCFTLLDENIFNLVSNITGHYFYYFSISLSQSSRRVKGFITSKTSLLIRYKMVPSS